MKLFRSLCMLSAMFFLQQVFGNTCRECDTTFWPKEGENGRLCRNCAYKKQQEKNLKLLGELAKAADEEREARRIERQQKSEALEKRLFTWIVDMPDDWSYQLHDKNNADSELLGAVLSHFRWVDNDSKKALAPFRMDQCWYPSNVHFGLLKSKSSRKFCLFLRSPDGHFFMTPYLPYALSGTEDSDAKIIVKSAGSGKYLVSVTYSAKITGTEYQDTTTCYLKPTSLTRVK